MPTPTQLEYNTTKANDRPIRVKFNLLNYKLQIVDSLNGVVVGTPTFSNNAQSDIRRTCSISLIPTDSSFDIQNGNKIWLDKFIQVYIGIEDIISGVTEYTNMGVYMINNPTRVYSGMNNTMTIEGLDLMAKLTGLRNGNLEGMTYTIPQGSNVRTSIINTLTLAGFTNYVVEECTITVPNDIKIAVGGNVYQILKALRDLLPDQYQMYFDVNGVFHYETLPTGANEQVMIDDDIFTGDRGVLEGYTINTDFENIKNEITVIGKTHDISNFGTATVTGSTYTLSIASITSLTNNKKIGFVVPNNVANPYISLNSFGSKALKYEDGTFAVLDSAETTKYYVAKYQKTGDYWLFMGEVTPKATVQELNPSSPFYINGTIGVVREVLSGGEYDNIYTSKLALARAKWELYNSCRIQDNVTLTCAPIYWADVNWVIEITLPNKQGIEETNKYIIKQINTTLGNEGRQTITAMRYYSYYATE